MVLGKTWFSEINESSSTAFSLEFKQKLHEEQTEYQKIEILETETFGKLMVIDGCIMLTQRDNFFYHEMMSHPVMFTHPNPENVLIIGGGDCGTLQAVLKHDEVKVVQQVDIDERVTRLSEQYFPELCASNGDSRARFLFVDGIQWVKEAKAMSYDVVIVDSTDPIGPAEGLFSQSFYEEVFRVLKQDGILVQQSESALFHMALLKAMYRKLACAGFLKQSTLFFPQCVYPSGWWSATMAAKTGDLSQFRAADVETKTFDTQYYNAEIHRAALAKPEFFKRYTHHG
ncbi:MAG TPA: polyamine aminopropyltransferase [Gammaproteobacteria bacterium]|nr:polyamine aminopropyltransferase [Gammaproteobacteria bacterium]